MPKILTNLCGHKCYGWRVQQVREIKAKKQIAKGFKKICTENLEAPFKRCKTVYS